MRLIRTFGLLSDESGRGYYRRLSAVNGFAGWKELARVCEVSMAKGGLLLRPEHVAGCLGIQPEWAREAAARDEVARGWCALRRPGDAVCPECLRESAHVRTSWEHAYVVACAKHRVLLIDHCDACETKLASHRERIEQCPCGQDLRRVKTSPALPGQVWLAALLSSDGAWMAELAPRVEGVSIDVLSTLVRVLCTLSDPEAVARQNSAAPRTVRESAAFLAPLERLLDDWPRGFEAHVSTRLARGNPEGRTLNTRLGKWYAVLKSCCTEGPLSCFLDAVARVASAEFDGLLGLDTAAEATNQAATHILLAEAARRIGVHRDTLASYVKRGQLPFQQKRFGTRGKAYLVSVDDVSQVVTARREWVSEEEAGALLDVPRSVLLKLADAGLLVHDMQWRSDVRKGGPVGIASVQALRSRLSAYSPRRDSSGERIALREMNSRRAGDHRALVRTLAAIAQGEILPVNAPKTVGALEYSLAEVGRYFSRPILEAGVSVQGLSRLTGWKWESINHWIEQGLLKSSSIVLRGQPARVVMPEQLLEFSRTFIPLSDLSRELGTKSSALSARMPGLDVVGALVLPGGQRRGGLVRIGDLARLALAALATKDGAQ